MKIRRLYRWRCNEIPTFDKTADVFEIFAKTKMKNNSNSQLIFITHASADNHNFLFISPMFLAWIVLASSFDGMYQSSLAAEYTSNDHMISSRVSFGTNFCDWDSYVRCVGVSLLLIFASARETRERGEMWVMCVYKHWEDFSSLRFHMI